MAAMEGIKQHQSTWSPYDHNGGTCIAIAGANYCVIAADTRMSTSCSILNLDYILTRDYSKICKLSDKCVMASSGFQADVKALQKNLSARHLIYQHQHNKQMSCPAMAQLLSNTLYYKRFFPYHSFNVLGGLDNEGKGCVFTYDAVGSYERVGYGAQGTGGKLMMPVLDDQLKSLSPLLLPAQRLKPISVGPWGRSAVEHEKTWDDWMYSGIRQIEVVYDVSGICSIKIEYDKNGRRLWLEHGKSREGHGVHTEKIQLDYPREILTSLSGCYDKIRIESLTFKSNRKEYGPYGPSYPMDNFFSLPISYGKIVGFHGRSTESYLTAIGVYLSNVHSAPPPRPISVGPFGREYEDIVIDSKRLKLGSPWNDGKYLGIRQIEVVCDEYAICSINIEYDNNGSPLWLKHERSGEDYINKVTHKIQLDYPREILTSISGRYTNSGMRALTSLTFKSNNEVVYECCAREHGVIFANESRTGFSIPISHGKIVAFHGRSDKYLHCIGVHLAAVPQDATTLPLESEAVDLVKKVFALAAERDIYTGDGLEIVVVNAEGVKREFLELRRD